jgi:type I restriction enzyme S subunit
MIADLNPYPAMKDSAVRWLGEVPDHWEVLPNRAIFIEVKERDHPGEQMLSVTITKGVIQQQALLADSSKKDSSNQDKSAYKLVRPGDIAYNKMRAWQGAVGVSDYQGIVSPAYVVQRPRVGADARYLHYLLRTPAFAKEAERWSYGITSDMWSLRPEHFKMIYGCLPPLPEQAAIVRFLDYVDRRIRRHIGSKQKLIKLLEEQRQVIIHRAVTRGLDPNVRLKPSGVEWLGDVPEHWEVKRVKQTAQVLRGKFTHRPRNDPSLYDGPYPFIQTGEVARAEKSITSYRQTLNERGLAVSRMSPAGTLVMTIAANIGDVAVLDFEACFPDSVVGFVPRNHVERDFLYYVFRAMKPELLREAPVNTQGNLNVDRIGSRGAAIPPVVEQQLIVRRIEADTARLNAAVEHAQREISLLREYRTRLIADVVTGKLDVREAAARLPGDPEEPEPVDEADALTEVEGAAADDLDTNPEEAEA